MKQILTLLGLLCCTTTFAQHIFYAQVQDSTGKQPLAGVIAVVKGTTNGATSGEDGAIEISNIPAGEQTIIFSLLGYSTKEHTYIFPKGDEIVTIYLQQEGEELGEIIVEGTRSNRSIANIPTRVEVLTEEIDEAATMDPSKVAHLLTHSTGIQVQQTSATSNTANVRIQGMDGRYTQILKDGFPLYGGFSGSLSIMQIPPLDLRQVEYIKGSASTLYGGGAISGLINLISKEPTGDETIVHINASQIGAFDANSFLSRKIGKMGITLLAQRNTHKAFDADDDGYTDMPALTKYNFNPRLFFYISERTKLSAGGTFTTETRRGGDIHLLNGEQANATDFYRELNDINRTTTQVKLEHNLNEKSSFSIRNSFNIFKRNLAIAQAPLTREYRFAGRQVSSFSELAYSHKHNQNVLITGLNFYTDGFKETPLETSALRNEGYNTLGAFANYTFDLNEMIAIESGLRADYVLEDKLFVLPRVSALFRWTSKLTTRIGGGMGYRNPTIFNQEAEIFGYRDIARIDKSKVDAEESYGGSADIGFKTPLGNRLSISINQMFFYTHLQQPLILTNSATQAGYLEFINADGYTQSYGAETFFKFGFYDFVFFAGYTYTHATNHFAGKETAVTLTPTHSLKGDLLYALPGKWRIGVDYEYKSSQTLGTGAKTPSYWTYGAVVEYTYNQFTVYGNVENFTDVRQTNYGSLRSLRSLPYFTPQFTEVWAPLDGFVFNTGFKVRL
jgi:outer membrane receptor for ferrienterochelin and colicins